jgi:hypothetical protein
MTLQRHFMFTIEHRCGPNLRSIALLTRWSPDTDCDLFSGQDWDISLLLESSFSSCESGMFNLQIL